MRRGIDETRVESRDETGAHFKISYPPTPFCAVLWGEFVNYARHSLVAWRPSFSRQERGRIAIIEGVIELQVGIPHMAEPLLAQVALRNSNPTSLGTMTYSEPKKWDDIIIIKAKFGIHAPLLIECFLASKAHHPRSTTASTSTCQARATGIQYLYSGDRWNDLWTQ